MKLANKLGSSIAGSFKDLSLVDFLAHLTVKPIERHEDVSPGPRATTSHSRVVDIFEGRSNQDFGWGRLFGGQAMAQALSAASLTVDESMDAHWMSCMFVREGTCDELPRFAVEHVRNGRSFASRRVRAYQDHGDILDMLVNYHVEEPGYEHQANPMPSASSKLTDEHYVHPDKLGPNRPRYEALAKELHKPLDKVIPTQVQYVMFGEEQPVHVRPGLVRSILDADEGIDPHQYSWFKTNGSLEEAKKSFAANLMNEELPGDASLRNELTDTQLAQSMLAFMVDFGFLGTSLLPHKATVWSKSVMAASLTHSMHFHKPFTFDDWILFEQTSPVAANARGFVSGEIFDAVSGDLVCTTLQEGLIRPVKPKRK